MDGLGRLLMACFLCVEGIVLFNVLIAVLGDGFDRVKAKEEEIRYHRYARYLTDKCFFLDYFYPLRYL